MFERRFTELRQEGRRLSGVAVTYGEIGQSPFGPERFEAGAFGDLSNSDVILNFQHDRGRPLARTGSGLFLDDSEKSLDIRAELPRTTEADNVLELVKAGVLRGLSIEFKALQERQESQVRVIQRALLGGVGVVDSGAYPSSRLEARRRGARSFARSTIPYRKTLGCECHRGACNKVRFKPGAFDEAMAGDGDVLAIGGGDFSRAIASMKRGTMTLENTDDGLSVTLSRAAGETPAGRELAGMAAAVPIRARPIFDQDLSDFVESGSGDQLVADYSRVHLRAILFKPVSDQGAWPEVDISGPSKRETLPTQKRRRPVWL